MIRATDHLVYVYQTTRADAFHGGDHSFADRAGLQAVLDIVGPIIRDNILDEIAGEPRTLDVGDSVAYETRIAPRRYEGVVTAVHGDGIVTAQFHQPGATPMTMTAAAETFIPLRQLPLAQPTTATRPSLSDDLSDVAVRGSHCPECNRADVHHGRCGRQYYDLTHPAAAPSLPPHPFELSGPGGTCGHAFDAEFKSYCGLPAAHDVHRTASAPYSGGEGR